MTERSIRITGPLFFCFAVLISANLHGETYEDWLRAWETIPALEEASPTAQLVEQTRLLEEAISSDFPLDPEMWNRLAGVLVQWENSAEIESARDAYISLLRSACLRAEGQDTPLPDEGALRGYLQRALSLAEPGVEEGEFLLFVAESWIRSASVSTALLRRAESLLQQAITLLDIQPPMDVAHYRLGQLYELLGDRISAGTLARRNSVSLSKAVWHYELVRGMEFARPQFKEASINALLGLLEPELELKLEERHFPNDAVRLGLRSRNLDSVTVSVIGLPPGEEGLARTLQQLQETFSVENPDPLHVHSQKTFSVRGRYPHDWRNRQVRLDADIVGGWYGLRIEGEDILLNELLLISPLEVAAFPRQDGSLLLWICDGETGRPVPGASATVFSKDGSILARALSGMDGLVVLDADQVVDWDEVHVMAGSNPGHVRRQDLPMLETPIPWIITNPLEVSPGGVLHWTLIGIDAPAMERLGSGPVFHLPDGSQTQPDTFSTGPDWVAGSLQIPSSLTGGGPIYADPSNETRIHVGHIRANRADVLDLQISGERLSGSTNLYHAPTPLGVSITPAFGAQTELPDFIRLRVSRLNREPIINPQESVDALPDLLYESILPFDNGSQKELFLELPDLYSGGGIQALNIEVLPLNNVEPLSRTVIGLVPYRRLVSLGLNEHIVNDGTEPVVHMTVMNPDETDRRSVDGDLVVYRETWQNRYIHRRHGTPLSEIEYQALPDRSLLGAAKTDYRLVEEGFIREEVQRIPVELRNDEFSMSVPLDQPGYYILEFSGREVDTVASYPDGPLELWVISGQDPPAFRSEKPRLVMENDADGSLQALVLLDQPDSAVLMDFEREDKSTFTRVSRPEETALFLELDQPVDAGLTAARILVVGGRQIRFLTGTSVAPTKSQWELSTDRLFGLNPGVEFDWQVSTTESPSKNPSLWTFYSDDSQALSPDRLRWQSNQQSLVRHHPQTAATYTSLWLPVSNPFTGEPLRLESDASTASGSVMSTGNFLSLFPEVKRFPVTEPTVGSFNPVVELEAAGQFGINGNFPSSAGRWGLTLLGDTGHHALRVQSWRVSTELPIRSTLAGPEKLRLGDRVKLPFTVQNTTVNPVVLDLVPMDSRIVRATPVEASRINLRAGESQSLELEVLAVEAGIESLDVRVEGSLSSEAVHSLEVGAPLPGQVFRVQLVEPDSGLHEDSLSLAGWTSADWILAPGPGALLPEIWPSIRDTQNPPDFLLTSLCEWAIEQVLYHHGETPPDAFRMSSEELAGLLAGSQLEPGGWGWFPDGAADPWLSSLIVWALEMFSSKDETALDEILFRSQGFLESVLIDEAADTGSRLFALRALAVPALQTGDARPSRIQARTFLDYFHQQVELPDAQVALLLQVAKAYGFRQEVTLLSDELIRRGASNSRFWPASLVYLALDDTSSLSVGTSRQYLQQALLALGAEGPTQGWEQLAGFLNLLAAYYWKGDFHTDGEVVARLSTGFEGGLVLNAGIEKEPVLKVPLRMDELVGGRLEFELDMQAALSPVLVAAIGRSEEPDQHSLMSGISVEFLRQFFENTLLQGTRSRSVDLNGDLGGIHVGDTLKVLLSINLDEPREFARLHFPVPAGMRLSAENISHLWEPGPEDSTPEMVINKLLRESADLRTQTLSIGPLPAGRHLFTLSYDALWEGTFDWPESKLVNPRTGEVFQLLEQRSIDILPAKQ